MDGIEIPAEQVVRMEAIASGIRGLRIVFVNVFAVAHEGGSWTLIDAGLPLSEGLIRSWADEHFGRAPNAIIVTHGHFDHVSSALALADKWDVPVYAHELEFPYLTGELEYPAPNVKAGGGVIPLLSAFFPRGPVNLGSRLKKLAPGSVPQMPGWECIHTPGHTPGHVSFLRSEDGTLLVGDAFCTTKQESFFEASIAQHPELHGPPAYFTWNWDLARSSVQRLAELNPEIVVPGHGKPLAGTTVPEALKALARNFDEIAVPTNER